MSGAPGSAWPKTRVKRITSKIGSGKTPTGGSETYEATGVLFLRSQNIHSDGIHLDDVVYISDETDREMASTRVCVGDALLNITGASLGRIAHVTSGLLRANVNQHVCIVRPQRSFDARYLTWSLAGHHVQQQILALQVGGNRDGLNFEQVGNLDIPLPPLDEQCRIADFLDAETARIDRLRALQISVLHRLDQRDRAVRDNLVDSLVDQVGELPLRRYASKIEQGSSPSCASYPRESGEWGVIKLSAVKRGKFFPEENKRLPDDIEPFRRYELRDGDLLVSRANTPELVGDVAVVEDAGRKLLLPDLIYRVGLGREIRADFAAQVFLSTRVRSLIRSTARGSSQSMVKLRGEDIREWPVPQANNQQQEALISAVGNQLESSARLSAVVDRQLALLAERRQALITAAITGQIDVTTARGISLSGGAAI